MKIFMTGATGYIGSAVARELRRSGHDVVGLTRRAARASGLEELGVRPVVADLRDADSYRDEAESADALIHLAAEESEDARPSVDRAAIDALLTAARAGGVGVMVYTSGCFVLGETGSDPADESASVADPPEVVTWRPEHERIVLEAAGPGLATAVIRPGMVYGGSGGVFAEFFASAERDGAAAFVGDGANHWSPVHREDVARLYRLVVEERAGGIFHCAEPAGLVGNLAVAASRAAGADGATRRIRLEEAREEMGAFADALAMDQVMGCTRARELGWEPQHPPFVESADGVYAEYREGQPPG